MQISRRLISDQKKFLRNQKKKLNKKTGDFDV